jgi:hypothetical protein
MGAPISLRKDIGDITRRPRSWRAVFGEAYNWVRPHEAIGFVAPMVRYLAELPGPAPESHLSSGETVQIS